MASQRTSCAQRVFWGRQDPSLAFTGLTLSGRACGGGPRPSSEGIQKGSEALGVAGTKATDKLSPARAGLSPAIADLRITSAGIQDPFYLGHVPVLFDPEARLLPKEADCAGNPERAGLLGAACTGSREWSRLRPCGGVGVECESVRCGRGRTTCADGGRGGPGCAVEQKRPGAHSAYARGHF